MFCKGWARLGAHDKTGPAAMSVFFVWVYRLFQTPVNRWRPYRVEHTGSLLTSEVKRRRARLVLGWGTAREDLRVLPAFDFAWCGYVSCKHMQIKMCLHEKKCFSNSHTHIILFFVFFVCGLAVEDFFMSQEKIRGQDGPPRP